MTFSFSLFFFFSSRRRHTRFDCDWSSDVCSSDLRPRSSRDRRNVHRRATAFPAALGGQAMGDEDDLLKAAQKNDLAKAQEILDRHPPLLRMKTPNGTLVLTATFYGAADVVKLLLARTPEDALNLYE